MDAIESGTQPSGTQAKDAGKPEPQKSQPAPREHLSEILQPEDETGRRRERARWMREKNRARSMKR
jgi:hypothetical protein